MKERKTLKPLVAQPVEPPAIKPRTMLIPAPSRVVEYRPPITLQPVQASTNTAIKAGWICLLIGFLVACVPGLGMAVWLFGVAPIGIAFLMGIIGMATGKIAEGIFLSLASVTIAPVVYFVVPLLSGSLIAK